MKERTILVSGAGGALGRALLAQLRDRPVRWVLLDRRADPSGHWSRAVDLLDEGAVAEAVATAEREVGPIDAAFMLAGGFATAAAAETDLSALREQFDLNLASAASLTRALLPPMLARGRGTIVGIAAGQARRGGARAAAYAASKAALAAYLRSVDAEVAPRGVRTITLYPMGTLDTPGNRQGMPDADPAGWIDPAQIAEALYWAVDLGPRARVRELEIHPDG
jgi:NAD(P)-dependent dehydrogenase (short-subunit alcohol dehydrogenase family)